MEDTGLKCLILAHIHMLHCRIPTITQSHLKMVKGGTRGGGVRVMAMKAMEAGALRMAPLVTGGACLSRVSKAAAAPDVLKVRVSRAGNRSEWCLNGSGALPAASSMAEPSGKTVKQHT